MIIIIPCFLFVSVFKDVTKYSNGGWQKMITNPRLLKKFRKIQLANGECWYWLCCCCRFYTTNIALIVQLICSPLSFQSSNRRKSNGCIRCPPSPHFWLKQSLCCKPSSALCRPTCIRYTMVLYAENRTVPQARCPERAIFIYRLFPSSRAIDENVTDVFGALCYHLEQTIYYAFVSLWRFKIRQHHTSYSSCYCSSPTPSHWTNPITCQRHCTCTNSITCQFTSRSTTVCCSCSSTTTKTSTTTAPNSLSGSGSSSSATHDYKRWCIKFFWQHIPNVCCH